MPTAHPTAPQVILATLGGLPLLRALLGATVYSDGEHALYVKFPNQRPSRGNAIRIHLDATDTYTVTFRCQRGLKDRVVREVSNLYARDLVPAIEAQTGYALHLPKVVRA